MLEKETRSVALSGIVSEKIKSGDYESAIKLTKKSIEINPKNTNNINLDEATRGHIRNLDVYVSRITEEMKAGRNEILHQVSSEIKLLAKLIAAQKKSSTLEK